MTDQAAQALPTPMPENARRALQAIAERLLHKASNGLAGDTTAARQMFWDAKFLEVVAAAIPHEAAPPAAMPLFEGQLPPSRGCKPVDARPALKGWAPGEYQNRCWACECLFEGDKRASSCADCAYDPARASRSTGRVCNPHHLFVRGDTHVPRRCVVCSAREFIVRVVGPSS